MKITTKNTDDWHMGLFFFIVLLFIPPSNGGLEPSFIKLINRQKDHKPG